MCILYVLVCKNGFAEYWSLNKNQSTNHQSIDSFLSMGARMQVSLNSQWAVLKIGGADFLHVAI